MLDELKEILEKKKELYLTIKARPGCGKTMIAGVFDDGTLKLDVKGTPQKGEANKELISYLAKEFLVTKEAVKIISGKGERKKLIKIKI